MEKIQIGESFILYKEDTSFVELHQIFVEENHRNAGIGTELLNKLREIAGNKLIETYSSTDPEKEVFGKWLLAEGFVKTNEQNSTGDRWILEPKKVVKEEIKLPKKNATKKKK